MKRTFAHPNKLTLTVRTESGAVSLDIGLEWLARQERKFLHDLVRRSKEGSSIGFGVDEGENGSSILKITLAGKQVTGLDQEAANVTPA